MNGFTVNLSIIDVCCDKCSRNRVEKDVIVTATSQTIALQCNFVLNVIDVTSTFVTVLIQNGPHTIIRRVFTNHPLQISLPCKNCTHLLSITATVTEV